MQKRLKKYAFFNENEVVRIRKTLVWSKIFFFVFVETKTDAFKNAFICYIGSRPLFSSL